MMMDVNPKNSLNLAGFTAASREDVYYSFDGGTTWTTNSISDLDDASVTGGQLHSGDRGDSELAFAADGTLYIAYMHDYDNGARE